MKNLLHKLKWRFFWGTEKNNENSQPARLISEPRFQFENSQIQSERFIYSSSIFCFILSLFLFIFLLFFFVSSVFPSESQQVTLRGATRRRYRDSWDSSPRSLWSSLQVWQVELFVAGSEPWTHIMALACKRECHLYLVQLTEFWQWRELPSAYEVRSEMVCLENTLTAIFLLRMKKLV